MEQKKFLRYCPNCNNYDKSTGACSCIHENVLEYPDRFIKYCDGKYLSLIKGRSIEPLNENEVIADDDRYIISDMVTVFSQNNFGLFQIAKSILRNYRIKFWSNAEYMGPTMGRSGYDIELKVFKRDEKAARKILSELETGSTYVPSNKLDKEIRSFTERWGILIIVLSIIILIMAFFIFKKN